ncbi:DMT family transporter [Deferribacter thermophilus]|uniref:DMT family transporter n=1 Tax=Deferribacter thermophilus TaxID=53573 RepID=UPI003C14F769
MTYLKLLFATIFWGASFTAGKVAVKYLPVFTVAFYRFFISSIILIFILKKLNINFTFKFFKKCVIGGITGVFLYNYFFLKGLQLTDASKASIIVASNPVITALITGLFLKEKLSLKNYLGVLLSFFGVVFIISKGEISTIFSNQLNFGDILIVFAAFSWSAYTIFGKIALNKISAVESTTYAILWGTIFLLPFYINDLFNSIMIVNLKVIISLIILSIFTTVLGFLWFYEGIKGIGATKASAFIFLVPVFGSLFGILILHEKLNLSMIFGGFMTLCGVYLTNKNFK